MLPQAADPDAPNCPHVLLAPHPHPRPLWTGFRSLRCRPLTRAAHRRGRATRGTAWRALHWLHRKRRHYRCGRTSMAVTAAAATPTPPPRADALRWRLQTRVACVRVQAVAAAAAVELWYRGTGSGAMQARWPLLRRNTAHRCPGRLFRPCCCSALSSDGPYAPAGAAVVNMFPGVVAAAMAVVAPGAGVHGPADRPHLPQAVGRWCRPRSNGTARQAASPAQ